MNTMIRFLTFSASRPTHWYEREAYMGVRGFLALAALVPSLLVSTSKTAPWILLSTIVSLVGAWSAQVARSGAARREETRRARNEKDVGLSCDAELRRAAAIGSWAASLAPWISLGVADSSSGLVPIARIAVSIGSAFDVAWSAWIYPTWRRRYTRERDALRAVRASVEHKSKSIVDVLREGWGVRVDVEKRESGDIILRQNEYFGRHGSKHAKSLDSAEREDEPEDAPPEVMTRAVFSADGKRSGGPNELLTYAPVYVRCGSLDDLLAKVDADVAEVGTRLYLNDDSPVVERGEGGWFVDWLDGTTGPTFLIRSGKERERFLAMAEGRDA